MKKHNTLCLFIVLLFLTLYFSCKKDDDTSNTNMDTNYQIGKNRFTKNIKGDEREYYVHVPSIYDKNHETPVVFMLHGTSGDGEKFYNYSGWKELGEIENIITVYPSSWHHCIFEINGQQKHTTKWHVYPGGFTYCSGEIPKDDIHFLKEIINELHQKFNIDSKRIYMVGFSNGGAMAFRSAVEMSDTFAAVVEASGTIQVDTLVVPKRQLPIYFQTGNSDDKFLGPNKDVPITSIDSLLSSPGLKPIMNTHLNSFNFSHGYSSIAIGLNGTSQITYSALKPDTHNRHLKFILIEDLEHIYPNGFNHPFKAAEAHWEWLKDFSLP